VILIIGLPTKIIISRLLNLPDSELTSARFLADLLLAMKKVN
jgi:hypothetical protein